MSFVFFHHLLFLLCSFLSPQVGIDCVLDWKMPVWQFCCYGKSIQRISKEIEFVLVWEEEEKTYISDFIKRTKYFSQLSGISCILKHEINGSSQNVHDMSTYVQHTPVPWRNHSIKCKGYFSHLLPERWS